ncbi:MAG TPA: calcium/sodium antiporter [Planctomycetes bacterium]|nr:calcium/sodium antiporter [Planctomycetota bacterium]
MLAEITAHSLLPLIFLLLGGGVLLWAGAEFLVKGGIGLAQSLGFSPILIGSTVLAFGTSAPEGFVSVMALFEGRGGVAVGNILGSNVCNLGLVLGATALLRPMKISRVILMRELPIVFLATLFFWGLIAQLGLGRVTGGLSLLAFAGIYLYLVRVSRIALPPGLEKQEREGSLGWDLFFVIGGLAALAGGGHLFVEGAGGMALRFGMSEEMIGATVIAFGTSLPELVTSLVAAFRGEIDLSLGNLLGSNLFNLLLVGGFLGVLRPISVGDQVLAFQLPMVAAITLLIYPLCLLTLPRMVLGRIGGGALVLFYLVFLWFA